MPAFSYWFHLTPPDFDLMTRGEFDKYVDELRKIDEMVAKQK